MFKTGITVGVVALVAVSGMASAGCSHHTPEGRANWVVKRVSNKLDLNETQRKSLEEIKVLALNIRAKYAKDRETQLEQVKRMILADQLKKDEVRSLIDQRHSAMEKEFDGVFEKVAVFHATLSAEQKQKAVGLIEKFASHMRD